jgi:serine/threonine protein kinase
LRFVLVGSLFPRHRQLDVAPTDSSLEMPRDHASGVVPPHPVRVSGDLSDLPAFIGPYRILGRLGEGGMGVVYLAEQSEPIRREVALKVLQVDARSDLVVARFESERQALAVMEHPGITKVFDAGTTPAGWPYFVMERVDGVSITEYADNHRLDLRARVRLFVQVCNAVQHAHQKGIIHRDLKPSNVLVTEADDAPLCKIIDFGIAKATETTGSSKLTRTGLAIGTPAYMSPEQAMGSGLDVDTRSDIYSMGVLLYELLTGELPFDATAMREQALMARHVSEDALAPSARFGMLAAQRQREITAAQSTDPGSLRRALRGDLDNVVMRTLEKEREHRYPTANDLAADLERYLDDKPVLATPQSGLYRARKFVRRHSLGVAFAGTVLLLLVTFAVGATVQARRLAHARAALEVRQGQSEELIGFMLGDLLDRLSSIGRLDLLDEVSKKALAYLAAVPESELTDEELHRRAQALQQLGDVRFAQGKLPAAASLMQRSLTLSTALAARDSINPRWQLGLAHSHFGAGSVDWNQGNTDAALTHFEPFVRISDGLISRFPDSLSFRAERAYALNNIGFARDAKGDASGALNAYLASLAIFRDLVVRDTSNTGWRLSLALEHNAAGVAQRKLGDLAGALASHKVELAEKRALAARDTTDNVYQRHLGLAHFYLGDLYLARGDVDSALADGRRARDLFAALVARDSNNTQWGGSLARSQRLVGLALLERNDAVGALRELDRGRAIAQRILLRSPGNPRAAADVAAIGTARARALLALRRPAEALGPARDAAASSDSAAAAKPSDIERRRQASDSYLALGDALDGSRDAAGALAARGRALSLVDAPARRGRQTDLLVLQASSLLALGRADDARPVAAELLRRGYRRPAFIALLRANGLPDTA